MTKDDIIRMAKEAGKADGTTPLERSIVLYAAKSSLFLEKFANLVAAAERETCAITCEQAGIDGYGTLAAAAAIRARGQE